MRRGQQLVATWPHAGRGLRRWALLPLAMLAIHAASAQSAHQPVPTAGRYVGELCVSTQGQPPQCGPVALRFRAARVQAQVSDIVYRLQLRSSQAEVVVQHGHVQIDEFIADYQSGPRSLRFVDAEKSVQYELRWPAAQARSTL